VAGGNESNMQTRVIKRQHIKMF